MARCSILKPGLLPLAFHLTQKLGGVVGGAGEEYRLLSHQGTRLPLPSMLATDAFLSSCFSLPTQKGSVYEILGPCSGLLNASTYQEAAFSNRLANEAF